ncbi:MAG: hypothetical protein JJ855_00310 [Rhodospirillales bacterium]|nr:hypothetical protein [Rhodospirillales bacterium]
MPRLLCLSENVTDDLRANISDNMPRYLEGDFADLSRQPGWEIRLDTEVDLSPLADLDPSGKPEAEIGNSRLVWRALGALRPSIACDERIWARLTHIECLEFTRARWLAGEKPEEHNNLVRTHFFARTMTRRRDDNAISRLWWNAWIAERVRPGTNLEALEMLLSRADIRSNIVERSRTASRRALADGILRAMERDEWVTGSEINFRKFMISVNREGGGLLFECLPADAVDGFMDRCVRQAQSPD